MMGSPADKFALGELAQVELTFLYVRKNCSMSVLPLSLGACYLMTVEDMLPLTTIMESWLVIGTLLTQQFIHRWWEWHLMEGEFMVTMKAAVECLLTWMLAMDTMEMFLPIMTVLGTITLQLQVSITII